MSKNKIKKASNDVTKLIPDFYEKFDEGTGIYYGNIILTYKGLKDLPKEFNQIKIIEGDLDLSENELSEIIKTKINYRERK